MAYQIQTFNQIRNTILQEIRNSTGISAPDDSDAAIRADGTASVIDGLYSHQLYIQRQYFAATADEPSLYLHAARAGVPRLGGTYASGTVSATANQSVLVSDGAKLTDGKGHYWSTIGNTEITSSTPAIFTIMADQPGSAWNYSGQQLNWISPAAGVKGQVNIVTAIAGGSDQEPLEAWRARITEAQGLGRLRDRAADITSIMKAVPGVHDAYVYPKRRGIGSVDVAILASGNPPQLPGQSLLITAQQILTSAVGFWADCCVFSPTNKTVNIVAKVTGTAAKADVEAVIKNYMDYLKPSENYIYTSLLTLIRQLDGANDIELTPAANIVPQNDWQKVEWLRLGTLAVAVNP